MVKRKNELAGLKPLEPHQEALMSFEGFEKEFIIMCGIYNTYEEAYEAVERKYSFVFKKRRYKSYESFRQARTRLYNAQRHKSNSNKKT